MHIALCLKEGEALLWRSMPGRDTGTLLREGPAHRAPLPPRVRQAGMASAP